MHAVVIREVGNAEDIDAAAGHLAEQVVPRVRQAPGFVGAIWLSDGAGRTLNILAFDSSETADAAVERVRTAPRPDYLSLESVGVYRVLAGNGRLED